MKITTYPYILFIYMSERLSAYFLLIYTSRRYLSVPRFKYSAIP